MDFEVFCTRFEYLIFPEFPNFPGMHTIPPPRDASIRAIRRPPSQFLKFRFFGNRPPSPEFVIFSKNPKSQNRNSKPPKTTLPGGVIHTKTCATSIKFRWRSLLFKTNSGKSSFCIFSVKTRQNVQIPELTKSGLCYTSFLNYFFEKHTF